MALQHWHVLTRRHPDSFIHLNADSFSFTNLRFSWDMTRSKVWFLNGPEDPQEVLILVSAPKMTFLIPFRRLKRMNTGSCMSSWKAKKSTLRLQVRFFSFFFWFFFSDFYFLVLFSDLFSDLFYVFIYFLFFLNLPIFLNFFLIFFPLIFSDFLYIFFVISNIFH